MRKRYDRLKEQDKQAREKLESFEFEKGDGWAMFIAAMITFIPALLIVIGLLWLMVWIVFRF